MCDIDITRQALRILKIHSKAHGPLFHGTNLPSNHYYWGCLLAMGAPNTISHPAC